MAGPYSFACKMLVMANPFEDRYRKMSEDELFQIAESGDEMVEDAESAFNAELTLRGIKARADQLRQAAADSKVAPLETVESEWTEEIVETPVRLVDGSGRKLVTIARFRDLLEAQLAQGVLQSTGIDCVLRDENIVRMDWFYSNAVGGIRLDVDLEDVESATEILNEAEPASFEANGEEFRRILCPVCHSTKTNFEEINKPISYTAMWLLVPLPVPKNKWHCQSCGHEWQQEQE